MVVPPDHPVRPRRARLVRASDPCSSLARPGHGPLHTAGKLRGEKLCVLLVVRRVSAVRFQESSPIRISRATWISRPRESWTKSSRCLRMRWRARRGSCLGRTTSFFKPRPRLRILSYRRLMTECIVSPKITFLEQFPTDQDRRRLFDEMVPLGFFNPADDPDHVWPRGHMNPQTYLTAPSSHNDFYNAHPGGLALTVAYNIRMADAYTQNYRQMYGVPSQSRSSGSLATCPRISEGLAVPVAERWLVAGGAAHRLRRHLACSLHLRDCRADAPQVRRTDRNGDGGGSSAVFP